MKSQNELTIAKSNTPKAVELPPFGFAYVWVYKSACAEPVRVTSPAGHTTWSAAAEADVDFPERCVFLLEGRDVGKDYVLRSGDVVFCRVLPALAVAAAVISTVAIVGGIIAGVALKKYTEDKIAKALKDATAVSASVDSTTSEEYPWLSGSANQVATGRTFPFIVGKTYFSPYKLCAAHLTFTDKTTTDDDGNETVHANANEFYNTVLEIGFNNVTLKELSLKNTVLADYSSTTTPQGQGSSVASTASGTLSCVESCLYYDSENQLEIRQDGDFSDLTQFNQKKIWTDVGSELPHDYEDDTVDDDGDGLEDNDSEDDSSTWISGITCELPSGTAAVEAWIELPTCYSYDSDGEKADAEVWFDAWWTNDGGATWTEFNYDTYGWIGTQEVEVTETSETYETTYTATATYYQSTDSYNFRNKTYVSVSESGLKKWLVNNYGEGAVLVDYEQGDTESEISGTVSDGNSIKYLTTYYTVYYYIETTSTVTENANLISANTTAVQRFMFYQEFTYSQGYGKDIIVRLRRTSQKYETDASSAYFLGVNTIHYDAEIVAKSYATNASDFNLTGDLTYTDSDGESVTESAICRPLQLRFADKCTRLGIVLKATDNTSGNLDYFNVIVQGVARTWDGSAWSSSKSETSNLAAWVLEILTTSHHLPSQYSDDELDLDTFGAWYEWCEQEGFCADGVISEDDKKGDILDTLLSNGFASLYVDEFTGLLAVAFDGLMLDDDGETYVSKDAIAVLNSDNIISMETTREYTRRSDGMRVSYVDAGSDYATNTFILMLDGGEYDPETDTLEDLSLSYVTNFEQAFKIAWRNLKESQLAPRSVSVQVSAEGAYYPLYSVVYLQHKALDIGLGYSRIESVVWSGTGYLSRINLTSPVSVPTVGTSVKYGVLINCQSEDCRGVLALQVYAYASPCSTLYITSTTQVSKSDDLIPAEGDALSIGELTTDSDGNTSFSLVSKPMKVTGLSPNGAGYTLELKDYNEAIYNYGTMPTYYTNTSSTASGSSVSGGSGGTSTATILSALQQLQDAVVQNSEDTETSAAASEITADEVAGLVSRGVHYTEITCVSEDMQEQLYMGNIETVQKALDDVHCDAMIAAELASERADALKTGTDEFEKLICSGQVKFTGLPTKDPGEVGRLWSDGGILRISVE